MTLPSQRALFGSLLALGLTATALGARAWNVGGPFSASIHDHQFQSAEVEGNDDCTVTVKLRFRAPKEKYQNPNKRLNHYRFRALLQFSDEKQLLTNAFNNREPGERIYTFSHDTTKDGCWAKQPRTLLNVDLEGCQGSGCHLNDSK